MTIKLLIVARFQLQREPPSAERDSKKESLSIIIVVVITFLLLWCPVIFYAIVSRLTGKRLEIKNEASNPLRLLARSNALCTPSLYLWASPSLRTAVWKSVWSKICCCKGSKKLVGLISSMG
ncbi:hypothetical protein LDENG_00080480 [Lucifuga dentata]|nr:hypothetical protein LDENG_00080480 [Lucifuga dentata]